MASKGLAKEQVEHVARLSWLPISSNELPKFQEQLSEVVEYISVIAKSKSKNQKAKIGRTNVTRKDGVEVVRTLTQDKATSGTTSVHNGLFVVPAIFEEI